MDLETELTFDFNLQQMAMLATAQAIWAQTNVKNKIKNIFLYMNRGILNEWHNLTKEVMESIPLSVLPKNLYVQLKYIVKDIGCRIYDWHLFLRNFEFLDCTFKEDNYDIYFKEIHWTKIGTIDEVKILRSWCTNPHIDVSKLFLMACLFCVEDLIDVLWERIANPEAFECPSYSELHCDSSSYILTYWKHKKKSSLDQIRIRNNPQEEEIVTLEETLTRESASGVYHLATKYFWQKLTAEKKQEIIADLFKEIIDEYTCTNHDRQYREDRFVDLYIFFLNILTSDQKNILFDNDKENSIIIYRMSFILFRVLSSAYPWQELIFPTFKQLQKLFDVKDTKYIFEEVISSMASNSKFQLPVNDSILQRQLFLLWKTLSSEFKFPVAKHNLQSLFDLWDLKTIKLILNDGSLRNERSELLAIGYGKFIDLITYEKWEMIDQFVEELLIFKMWKPDVKEQVKMIYSYIIEDQDVDSAEEFLNSEYESEEDRKNILKNINYAILCYYLIKVGEIQTVYDVFRWAFPSENDLTDFKIRLRNTHFTVDLIYEMWHTCSRFEMQSVENLSSEFLGWLFNDDKDEVTCFKYNEIYGPLQMGDNKKLSELFYQSAHFEVTSKFLSWCLCSSKEIDKILQPLLADYLLGECEKIIQKNKLNKAETLLQWAFTSEEQRLDFKKKFIIREKLLDALVYFIGTANCKESDPEIKRIELTRSFKECIKFWLFDLENIRAVQRYLIELRQTKNKSMDENTNEYFSKFISYEAPLGVDYERNYEDYEGIFWNEENLNLFLSQLAIASAELNVSKVSEEQSNAV